MNEIEANYDEQYLFPASLEEWVGEDHPARFLREVVSQLDLETLGFRIPKGDRGRPGYAPRLLLRVWLYGYWKRIRSSRRVEEACRENLGFVWLCGMKAPDHNTLWRFFRTNKKALRRVFTMTVRTAVELGLVKFALQALDGTKIQAVCSEGAGYDRKHLAVLLNRLEQRVLELEREIEASHRVSRDSMASLPETLRKSEALRDKVRAALAAVDSGETRHCHPQEPESRRMKCGGRNRFGYNAQAMVDSEERILVAEDVSSSADDSHQLTPLMEQAGENAGENADVVVADGGYADSGQLAKAEERDSTVLVPLPSSSIAAEDDAYHCSRFRYDEASDEVICPEGRRLPFRRERVKNPRTGHTVREYRSARVCRDCPVREACTGDRHGRTIELPHGHSARERLRERLEDPENRALLQRRGEVVELVFAWIKHLDGFRRWTARGLENARAQWSTLCAVWNLKRIYQTWLSTSESEFARAMKSAQG